MNKSDLIEALAKKGNLKKYIAEHVVTEVFAAMSDALAEGDGIEIRGFGSFYVKEYESYTGRNPKTGEKIQVKPKKLPLFKMGKELKERLQRHLTNEDNEKS